MDNSKSLKEQLLQYNKETTSFHMPGHKGGRINPLAKLDCYDIDVTEVDATDNLHHPEGIIKEAMNYAKAVYKTKETFYMVNGSSGGLLAAIAATTRKGERILMARNCHKAVYNSVILNELDPIYYYAEYIEELKIFGGISPKIIEKYLQENEEIRVVIVTSPTYEGIISNIEAIAKIVHQYHKVLIVDEAHGAHLNYYRRANERIPQSALECGADIVIQSLHKTLPALTQTALLHVNSERINVERLKTYLSIYQTSSPSYVLMSSIDSCIRYMNEEAMKQIDEYIKQLEKFRCKIEQLTNIQLLDKQWVNQYEIMDVDLTRLSFFGINGDLNGKKVESVLREKYSIGIEMSMLNGDVLISTLADREGDFNLLFEAFKFIDDHWNTYSNRRGHLPMNFQNTVCKLKPMVAFEKEMIIIELKKAVNQVSGEFINLYPPGIPLIVPGEIITEDLIQLIIHYLDVDLTVIGVDNNKVKIVKL